ncbi:MAG: hypothetical protein KGP28_07080 [Bdellovibrionales bacterium]|nr:hypothetical protein [Bdellovibrionales bacterium]
MTSLNARGTALFMLIPLALLFWISVPWLAGTLTGWKSLAQNHSFKGSIPTTKRWTHCSVPNLTLRNFLTVALDEKGMYFEMPFWFRIGNPPLFFGWSEIAIEEAKLLFRKTIRISFRNSDASFHFYPEQAEEFKRAAGPFWPMK